MGDPITAVVPTSPIPSHPEAKILEEALDSIRHHLPDAEIILTFDGVRPEQADRRKDYEEYIRRALWLADKQYGNVCPLVFDQHMHQTGMMRAALAEVRTPLLLYVEHDTPLVTDEPIEFSAITKFIEEGYTNLVRLHHESHVLPEHEHLCHGTEYGYVRTSQWSQRPHVASVAFYRRIMETCFSPESKSFIEDRMHSVCEVAYNQDGLEGWRQYAMHLYNPGGGNMKRSYHLDGRAGEAKWDDQQMF